MDKRTRSIHAVVLVALLGLCVSDPVLAADVQPHLSKEVMKSLSQAQNALQSGDFDEAILRLQEVDKAPKKTAFDTYWMNQMLAYALVKQGHFGEAVRPFEDNLHSSFASDADRLKIRQQLMVVYLKLKEYPRAGEIAETVVAARSSDPDAAKILEFVRGVRLRADSLKVQIVDAIASGDRNGALALIAQYRDLRWPMPLPLLLQEGNLAIEQKQFGRAQVALDEFFRVATPQDAGYSDALRLNSSLRVDAEKAERNR